MSAFSVADDLTLTNLIGQAQRRVIFLSPAVSIAVAKALVECLERLGSDAVAITLDVDAEVYRLGYGDSEALALLYDATRNHGKALTRHPGIRIGLLIVDDAMMVYAPTPLLIEAGQRQPNAPNAISLGPPPYSVIRELGLGESAVKDQTVGLDIASAGAIQHVSNDLERNPPQKFDIARTVRIFNAHFEFAEFELVGTSISRKTVPIPSKLMGFAGDEKTQNLLKASFQVVESSDNLSGKHLEHDKALIARMFLKSLPGYGNVILRARKAEFEKEVEKLRSAVTAFGDEIKEKLQTAMDRNRETLREALLPSLLKNPPEEWKMSDGSKPDNQRLSQLLDDELCRAFGRADRLVGKMNVKLVFKGVTYESLKDQRFTEIAKKSFPSLKTLLDEYNAAEGQPE